MTITCDACRTTFDAPDDLVDSAACPCCEHVNRPRERVEKIVPTPIPAENTADRDPPIKTMIFPAEGAVKDTGVTEVKRLRSKRRQDLGHAAVRLTVVEEGKPPRQYAVEKPRVVLGRGKCDVRVHDPEVSREHCAIEVYEGVATLRDLHSANGTVLNGHLVSEHVLKHGDQVKIGTTVVAVFMNKAA
jgi:hypothetical protein